MMKHIGYQKETDMDKTGLNMKWTWLLTCAMCLWTMVLYAVVPEEWNKNNIERLEYRMNIKARVHKDGEAVKMPGSVVAVFMGEQLRAVKEYDDGDGYYYFNLTVYADDEEEEGYTFKFYDSVKDKVYDLKIPDGMEPLPYKKKGYGQFATDGSGELEPFVLTLPTYSVTVAGGTANPARACAGDVVEIMARDTAEHELFTGWTSNDGVKFVDSAAKTTTFVMPAKNVTVTANFEEERQYDYTVVNGTTANGKAYAGVKVDITAPDRTAEHWIFMGWTGSDGVVFANPDAMETTFTMPAKDVTVTANYVKEEKVHYIVVNGTTTGGEDYAGTVISVEAKAPALHKIFREWNGIGVTFADPKAEKTTFELPKTNDLVTVTAEFDDEQQFDYTVVFGTPTSGKAYKNDLVNIKAEDRTAEHLFFDEWIGNVVFTDALKQETTFTMPANAVTVTATYREEGKFTVTVVGGTANPTSAYKNENVTLTADTTDPDKIFVKWTSNDVAITNVMSTPATFTMPENNVTVTAIYQYKVTVVDGTADKASALPDETVKVTANDRKEEHFLFDKWIPEGVTLTEAQKTANPLSFTMPANAVKLMATYKDEPQYDVVVNGGTADKVKAYAGETITVTADVPDEGMEFDRWTGDVAFADATMTVTTFIMPSKNVNVTATFSAEGGILLIPGWNLIALPGKLPESGNTEKFAELNAFTFDEQSKAYVHASLPLEAGKPLWIFSRRRQSLKFDYEDAGSVVCGLSKDKGWQFVGVGGEEDVEVDHLLAAWQWVDGRWSPLEINDGKTLLPVGHGCFIYREVFEDDGFPEEWKIHYFKTTAVRADDDADGDGLTNLEEYKSGSNPTIANIYHIHVINGASDKVTAGKGVTVTLSADERIEENMMFDKWISDDVEFVDATDLTTAFVMPAHDVTVTATYIFLGAVVRTVDGANVTISVKPPDGTVSWEVIETIPAEVVPTITSSVANGRWLRDAYTLEWSGWGDSAVTLSYTLAGDIGVYSLYGDAIMDMMDDFLGLHVMGDQEVFIEEQEEKYAITVVNGIAEQYEAFAGELVMIMADDLGERAVFDRWVAEGVEFEDDTGFITSFIMPAHDVTVTATYVEETLHEDAMYLVVDLSGGPNAESYPVMYSKAGPDLSDDTCRTTQLWLRRIPKGTFVMGSPEGEGGRGKNEIQHEVTLTQDYYMGVFECTQRQWQLVMGINPSNYQGNCRPVECVSYNEIRGEEEGAGWPYHQRVDATSFMGKLRSKTGWAFDLPTEAQWEYACRAETTTALNSGKNLTSLGQDAAMDEVGRYHYNQSDGKGGYTSKHTKVGSYLPNAWGLYDMHGNIGEWCLDWYGSYGTASVEDPVGPTTGSDRVYRGGNWNCIAGICRSASLGRCHPSGNNNDDCRGFRVACLP